MFFRPLSVIYQIGIAQNDIKIIMDIIISAAISCIISHPYFIYLLPIEYNKQCKMSNFNVTYTGVIDAFPNKKRPVR